MAPRLRLRVTLIIAIVTFLTWMFRHSQLDDSLIYARYIRNALQGQGLVFNSGEHVNALTSPLYSAVLLLLASLFSGKVLLAQNVLFAVCFAAAAALAERLAPWAGLLIVSTTYFYNCMGMETALFLLLLVLLVTLYLERCDAWIPLVALLLVLTRLEGGALVLMVLIQLLRERRFPSWRSFVLPSAVVIAYLSFNAVYYGSLLPSSGLAKFAQARSGYWGKWPTAFLRMPPSLYSPFFYSIYIVPLVAVCAAIGVWKLRGTAMNRILMPFFIILLSFYVLCNFPSYHWYYAPFIFFAFIYALLGVPPFQSASLVAALVMLQCVTATAYKASQSSLEYPYKQLGEWLDQNTPTNARVASVETGAIGWYSRRYVDDIIGLTSPTNAMYLLHHDFFSWLDEQKPDYVVMHAKPWFGELAAAKSSDYEYLPVHFGNIYLMRRRNVAR
jgi:arabinofuranosyltransferase